MTGEPRQNKLLDVADYPALREFFPAYLHQDFAEEYASAAEAAKGFLEDASKDEILRVKEEWRRFRRVLGERPLQEIQIAIERLGSAWMPENERQLGELDEIFGQSEA